MGQLYLVRHGQASFGAQDYDRLSELGAKQADLLGRWFKSCGMPVERIVAGENTRHGETAAHCMAAFDTEGVPRIDELKIDARLNEFDHAKVIDVYRRTSMSLIEVGKIMTRLAIANTEVKRSAVLSSEDLLRVFGLAMERWMSGDHDDEYDETWPAFRQRAVAAFEALTDGHHPAKTIVVFTSGGVIAAICQHLLGLTDKAARDLGWTMANTSVTRLLFTKGRRGLGYMNSTAHFEWAREPEWVTYR